jgi:hypothetical protein
MEKKDTDIRLLLCKDIESIVEFDGELSGDKVNKLISKYASIDFPEQKVRTTIYVYCERKGYIIDTGAPRQVESESQKTPSISRETSDTLTEPMPPRSKKTPWADIATYVFFRLH